MALVMPCDMITHDRFRRLLHRLCSRLPLLGQKRAQHIIGRFHARRRPADADPDPDEFSGPELLDDRPKSVMTAMPAADLDPDRAERQVKFVMHARSGLCGCR